MPLFSFCGERGIINSPFAEEGGLFQVNHKYPVFSGANIGIKPICLTIILCSLICIGRINVHK